MLDAPERVDLRREQVLGPPDRMIRRKRSKLKLILGEDLLHQSLEAPVEFPAAAAGLGEDETSLFDEVAKVLFALEVEIRRFVAVEENDGGLEHVLDGGAIWDRRPAR